MQKSNQAIIDLSKQLKAVRSSGGPEEIFEKFFLQNEVNLLNQTDLEDLFTLAENYKINKDNPKYGRFFEFCSRKHSGLHISIMNPKGNYAGNFSAQKR